MKLPVQVPVRLSIEDDELLRQMAKRRKLTRASVIRQAIHAFVKSNAAEYYPPGSLAQYYNRQRDVEELQRLKGCTLKVEETETCSHS